MTEANPLPPPLPLRQRWCSDDPPPLPHPSPAGTSGTSSPVKPGTSVSPGPAFPGDGVVVMETTPVGDVVEVGQADYLSTMVELADFSSVKVRVMVAGERGER